MGWECGICRVPEVPGELEIDAVCHHCGAPLCPSDRFELRDPAFGGARAFHCRGCAERYHPREPCWQPEVAGERR